ncbi:MAG: hypothetical protein ACI36V_05730 [Coriobacteriales bacterium]
MDSEGYQKWLLGVKGLKRSTCQSRISNCAKVERYEGDLDLHYERDRLESLLQRLSYTADDERREHPARHSVPLAGSLRRGSAPLKSAVTLYRDFKDSQHLDLLFVAGSNDEAAQFRQQMLWGEVFMKRFKHQLELLQADPLFSLLMDEVERRAQGDDVEAQRHAAVQLFAELEPQRRFCELDEILSAVCAAGHSPAAVYSSVYFAVRILNLARAAGDPA